MGTALSNETLDTLFREARSHNGWQDTPVTDEQLHQIYDLMKMGPTAANACPARLLFIKSTEAKERLKPCLSEGNVEKSMTAPVVVVIGMDMEFYEQLPKLFPHTDARSWYAGKPEEVIHTAAFRNSTLQGAYFIMAARSLGLDCGPMSGFDAAKLEAEFFPDGRIKANFICAIGHGDASKIFPRHPRLEFDEVCSVL
ncbi:MAG: malonic semialdehyde reductase [Gammaproteobacteria bacterium]|nr:malonic semialdehyde reductase [Gammaproteobacteria bacterium]MCK5090907.1 malonic semialdehyde reductase [Gammaproteobacteria bacterium]